MKWDEPLSWESVLVDTLFLGAFLISAFGLLLIACDMIYPSYIYIGIY